MGSIDQSIHGDLLPLPSPCRPHHRYRDWSNGLSTDILGEIISYFTTCGDRVRFAAVCKPWRRSAVIIKNNISATTKEKEKKKKLKGQPPHAPWLMLPGGYYQGADRRLSEDVLYHMTHQPQIQGQRCVGSGHGRHRHHR